jgi:hypothetical protein
LLRRTELVALINTLDKISSALKALEYFREAVAEEANVARQKTIASDTAKQPPKPNVSIQPKTSNSDLDELDDFEDLDTDAFATKYEKPPRKQVSIAEAFREEIDLVWRTIKFVLRSYLVFPKRAAEIFFAETWRLYTMWIGRPVPERAWEWKFPTRDDL